MKKTNDHAALKRQKSNARLKNISKYLVIYVFVGEFSKFLNSKNTIFEGLMED